MACSPKYQAYISTINFCVLLCLNTALLGPAAVAAKSPPSILVGSWTTIPASPSLPLHDALRVSDVSPTSSSSSSKKGDTSSSASHAGPALTSWMTIFEHAKQKCTTQSQADVWNKLNKPAIEKTIGKDALFMAIHEENLNEKRDAYHRGATENATECGLPLGIDTEIATPPPTTNAMVTTETIPNTDEIANDNTNDNAKFQLGQQYFYFYYR